MKKQVINLMMTLAIVFGLSVSAMAQLGADAESNNQTARYIMVAGSSHTFTITPGDANNTIAWSVWTDGGTVDNDTDDEDVTADTDVVTVTTTNAVSFPITWSRGSFGSYYVQVTETDEANATGCSITTRRFYISIIDFDVYIYASTASGEELLGDALTACGNGTTARYGDILDGTAKVAFSNTFGEDTDSDEIGEGDLISYVGEEAPQTLRYVSFQVVWNVGDTEATPPTVDSIAFDFNAYLNNAGTVEYTTNDDLVSVNGVTTFTAQTTGKGTSTATGPIASGATTVAGEVTTIEAVINDRWNHTTAIEDLEFYLTATNVTLFSIDGEIITTLGQEPTTYEKVADADIQKRTITEASNITATQVIQLAPATSPISVTQN